MKYFKNIELAKLYHVSEKSVRNWIQAAKESRLDLELYSENGRDYVANTTRNNMVVEQLVEKGKKYKNTRGFKKIYPKKEFYETYNNKQILDIISSITIHREIPIQYSYFDGGAIAWDEYANRMANEVAPNILNQSVELLGVTSSYLDGMFADKTIVNVVDVGPGNGLPVRATLERLLNQGKLGRYIAIDISQDMIDILERNIKKWFGEKITIILIIINNS